jgi:hypothetical protein
MHDVRTVFRPNRSGTGCIQGVSRTTPGGGTAGWVEDVDSSLVSDAVLYVLSCSNAEACGSYWECTVEQV